MTATNTFAMARARRALADAGLDFRMPIVRASSVTNEVWVAEKYVIRVNRHPNQRLRREAALGPLLPAAVGYPEIIGYGGELGADWLIVKRMPGEVLSRWWPTLTRAERREATHQVAEKLQPLHKFPIPADLPEIDSPQMIGGPHAVNPVDPLLAALDRAATMEHVRLDVVDLARRIVLDNAAVLGGFSDRTMVHGDLHFENVLWDGKRVTAVLDFEWARPAPPDLELDVFLRFCAYPYLHVAEDYEHVTLAEDYRDVPFWLSEAYPGLFARPHGLTRARIYCIAYDVRELLLYPPPQPVASLSPHHPYHRLERTVRGACHLDDFAERGLFTA